MVIDMMGMESASEEDPDNESADDLSIATIDSMSNINKDKVRDLWRQMAETKAKEATIYNQLADMVDDMSPAIIQETIIQTPNREQMYHQRQNHSLKRLVVLLSLKNSGHQLYGI